MADAKGIRAGRAYVEISTDNSGLEKGLRQAQKQLGALSQGLLSVGAKLGGAGAAITAPLLAAANVFKDMGDNLNDMSMRTGVSVESLSELGFAATQSGTDLKGLEVGLRKMQKTIGDAAGGSKEAQEALADLGVPIEALAQMNPEAQFTAIGDAISKIGNPTERAAVAMQIFGRSGTSLLPMFKDGAKGMAEMRKQAQDLGLVMSKEDAQAAAKMDDAWQVLVAIAAKLTASIGAALAPALLEVADGLINASRVAFEWIKNNQGLIQTVFMFGAALVAAGAALATLGTVVGAVATACGGLAAAVSVVGGVLAFVVSPLGLLIGLLVGLTAALVATEQGQAALAALGAAFTELWSIATEAFQGITDALLSGNFAKAAEILWLSLKLVWEQGVNALMKPIHGIREAFFDVFGGIATQASSILNWIVGAFEKAIATIEAIVGALGKTISEIMADPMKLLTDPAGALGMAGDNLGQALSNVGGRLDQIDETTDAAGAIINDPAEFQRVRDEAAANDQAKSLENLTKAREEFDAAVAEAGKIREETRNAIPSMKGNDPLAEVDPLGIEKAANKIETKGTFSAAALSGLGADSTTKAAQETADNTRRLLDKAKAGRLVFTA